MVTVREDLGVENGPSERLGSYRRKRDFTTTPEPAGSATPPPPGRRFVVQRHRARRLHYDLRLEHDGVLLSWAVPKGPTLDPGVRRLAAQVEDHPLEYVDFEGVIPSREYGGGDVIVWDRGTWAPADRDVDKALRKGDLHFDLDGEKLHGRFALVRSKDSKDWLLIHKHDDSAVPGWDPEEHPKSVVSGRTNDEVASAPAATWSSGSLWNPPTDGELAALDGLRKNGTWVFGGRELKLTNLDKVLFPGGSTGPFTKRDLVRHYARCAPVLLPYLHDRPVNLRRHPDGVEEKGFWQKAAPDWTPDWIPRWRYDDADPDETQEYLILDSPAALAWAGNHAAVELHPWTSTAEHPDLPTWALVDIDPGTSATFEDALVLARLYRTALEHLGVRGMPKVTGKRGIQIWIPLTPGPSFDQTRAWVEALSRAVGGTVPELVSWEWEVARRKGLTRLDYTQNAINKTLVAPFSPRATAAGSVSVPIRWDELDDPDLAPDRWDLASLPDRLRSAGDPLAPLVGLPQVLPPL
jgi:bifunctional non-homologous end joining protein LigD